MREWLTGLGLGQAVATDRTTAAPSLMAKNADVVQSDMSRKRFGSDEDDDDNHDNKSLRVQDDERNDRT